MTARGPSLALFARIGSSIFPPVPGFAVFSVDWTADLSGGVRLSDASLTASSASQLVLPGGSRLVVRGTGSLNVTPNRSISLGINGNVENDWYFARGGVNPDGAPAGVNLDALILGGGLKLDWTPDNAFYVVIQAGLNRTFANDPSVAQWSGTLSAGIEYSF